MPNVNPSKPNAITRFQFIHSLLNLYSTSLDSLYLIINFLSIFYKFILESSGISYIYINAIPTCIICYSIL